jgi:hypothetical protein
MLFLPPRNKVCPTFTEEFNITVLRRVKVSIFRQYYYALLLNIVEENVAGQYLVKVILVYAAASVIS